MRDLTARERFDLLFSGQPVDRVPVAPRVYRNVIYEYFGRDDVDLVQGALEYCRHFGLDIFDWNCTPAFEDFKIEGPNWKPTVRTESSSLTSHEIVTVETALETSTPPENLRAFMEAEHRCGRYED